MNIQHELKTKFYKRLPYRELAKKHNTTYDYIRLIASGRRKAVRGKALAIKKDLEAMIKEAAKKRSSDSKNS